ncbi:hypothetical protein [Streptomyces sp. NPDC057403]|uniref:hypothetical protein n=1 Tax=Streptomyces sp. NPDC057403 TaxID=3346119 RepID=UPI003677AC4F
MNRDQHLKLADKAVTRAEQLAGDATRYSADHPHKVPALAAAGSLWADIARAHAAIAAAKPETTED